MDDYKYDVNPSRTVREYVLNLCVVMVICATGYILYRFFPKVVAALLFSALIVCTGMFLSNMVNISKDYKETVILSGNAGDDPVITLSKNGKNVMVIMMDRMIGRFILEEDPNLYASFDGFTYYPNTVSFGPKTNAGSPGLYGGYEYIPEKMNERDDLLLVDKHNEALKIMPVLFDEYGMDVTVFDPKYAGYSIVPDLSIYDDYPDIKKYITMGNKSIMDGGNSQEHISEILNRNFFCYGLFKVTPLFMQRTLYNNGNYNAIQKTYEEDNNDFEISGQSTFWLSESHGVEERFMEAYYVLDKLDEITRINEDVPGSFLMMSNDATHEPMILKEPEYVPAMDVDNKEYDSTHLTKHDAEGNVIQLDDPEYIHEVNLNKVKHYQINMCTLKRLGEYFDYLKEEGVYDNTRIIIVSDHSTNTSIDDNYVIKGLDENGNEKNYDCEQFSCALMVKDYNSTGFKIDDDFMTNADVPSLAFKDIIENPVNPFTGHRIDSEYKYQNQIKLFLTDHFHITENNGYRFHPDPWFSVHDDIRVKENWSYLGYY